MGCLCGLSYSVYYPISDFLLRLLSILSVDYLGVISFSPIPFFYFHRRS
jgi:hypothetical protein